MTLSYTQRQALAALERDLAAEPTLAALTGLFADAPRQTASRTAAVAHTQSDSAHTPRRFRATTLVAGAVTIAGIGDAVIAGLLGIAALVSVGIVLVVIAVVVLVAHLSGTDRAMPRPDRNASLGSRGYGVPG